MFMMIEVPSGRVRSSPAMILFFFLVFLLGFPVRSGADDLFPGYAPEGRARVPAHRVDCPAFGHDVGRDGHGGYSRPAVFGPLPRPRGFVGGGSAVRPGPAGGCRLARLLCIGGRMLVRGVGPY